MTSYAKREPAVLKYIHFSNLTIQRGNDWISETSKNVSISGPGMAAVGPNSSADGVPFDCYKRNVPLKN